MSIDSQKVAARVKALTGTRFSLKPWEEVVHFQPTEKAVRLLLITFEVKELVREDRYNKRGMRLINWVKTPSGRWVKDFDQTAWDTDFEPFVYEKVGRRKTAEEFTSQREWEKLCYRPGTSRSPLDSYDRVLGDKTTPDMERYW